MLHWLEECQGSCVTWWFCSQTGMPCCAGTNLEPRDAQWGGCPQRVWKLFWKVSRPHGTGKFLDAVGLCLGVWKVHLLQNSLFLQAWVRALWEQSRLFLVNMDPSLEEERPGLCGAVSLWAGRGSAAVCRSSPCSPGTETPKWDVFSHSGCLFWPWRSRQGFNLYGKWQWIIQSHGASLLMFECWDQNCFVCNCFKHPQKVLFKIRSQRLCLPNP